MRTAAWILVASAAIAQTPGTFQATGDLTADRFGHTATLLLNGKVLIAGGMAAGATAELYDPATRTFTKTGDMTASRARHTATLLADGRVLIVGGDSAGNTAELYDPSTSAFTRTGDLVVPRMAFSTTLLNTGEVLITSGYDPSARPRFTFPPLASAELYDPLTGTFRLTGDMAAARGIHRAVLLPTGKVANFGSYDLNITPDYFTSELYDPNTGTFSLTTAQAHHHFDTPATLLTDGTVLFAGGSGELSTTGEDTAETYDPGSDTFSATGRMTMRRFDHSSTLLSDGKVLIAGSQRSGADGGSALSSAEVYDPRPRTFGPTGSMLSSRFGHTATLLTDGTVLIAGGMANRAGAPGRLAEVYTPASVAPPPLLLLSSGDGRGQGAILHADTHALASAANPAVAGEALEIYCTCLLDGGGVPPRVNIGGRTAEVLWFGNAPGFSTLHQINVRVPNGVAPGSNVRVQLIYLGRPSNEVSIGVR